MIERYARGRRWQLGKNTGLASNGEQLSNLAGSQQRANTYKYIPRTRFSTSHHNFLFFPFNFVCFSLLLSSSLPYYWTVNRSRGLVSDADDSFYHQERSITSRRIKIFRLVISIMALDRTFFFIFLTAFPGVCWSLKMFRLATSRFAFHSVLELQITHLQVETLFHCD